MTVHITPEAQLGLLSTHSQREIHDIQEELTDLDDHGHLFVGSSSIVINMEDLEIDDPELYQQLMEILEQ